MPTRLLLTAFLALLLLALPVSAWAADYVPGEVIVKYRDGTGLADRSNLQRSAGTAVEARLPGGSQQLEIADGASVSQTVRKLRSDPNVAYAVPNYRAHASQFTPDDPRLNRQMEPDRPLRPRHARGVADRDRSRGSRRKGRHRGGA